MQFTMYPIERVAQAFPLGMDDEDFDAKLLPIHISDGATAEDVSSLFAEDEFEIYKLQLGTEAIGKLERIRFAIIHRFPDHDFDAEGNFQDSCTLMKRSQGIVAEIAACLRLIRPTSQHTQMCFGHVGNDGKLYNIGFNHPLEFVDAPRNQIFFRVRTTDIRELALCTPLLRAAMHGPSWKFRIAVQMHEAGHFQNTEWKARFLLWSSALEALFASMGSKDWRQYSGSKVASERIKFLPGPTTLIYPPGELTSLQKNPDLKVGDVIDDIYCLRNHLAHGDRVPASFYELPGRSEFDGDLHLLDVLIEAISFIVRQTLLKILKDDLLKHFEDSASSEAFFTSKGLTKQMINDREIRNYNCETIHAQRKLSSPNP